MNLSPHFLIGIVYAISIMAFELMIAGDIFAQPLSLLDSLKRDVDRASNDTARIAALCRLSNRLVITEYNDSLGRVKANEAVHLAERLEATTAKPFASYYRALALQTLGVTYRFANETQRSLAEPLFQAAMEEARRIPDKVRSSVMQASVLHEWFTGVRFRLKLHFKNDKSIAELRSEAEQLLRAEQVIADELNNNALRGQVLLNRATILPYSDGQRLVLAMQSARLYEQAGDYTGLAHTLQYVGFFANYLGDYPFAMQAYKRSVRLQDSMGVQNGLAVCYNAMGDIYARLSDTIKALESYQRAETYSGQFDLKFDRIELLQKIGVLYQRQGLKEKARAYFVRAMRLNKEMNRQINDIIHAGQLYRQQDSLEASLAELTFALRWARKLTVQTPLRQVLYELALTYKQQAEEIKKMKHTVRTNRQYQNLLDSALYYGKQSLQLMFDASQEVFTGERLVDLYTLLYELSKEAGDIRSALAYHEELYRWKEKTVSNEKYGAVVAMDSRAVLESIEAKVETLKAEERLQRAVSIIIGIVTITLAAILFLLAWRYRERKRVAMLLQEQNNQLMVLNSEKNEFLGIAAHDLKNPLASILTGAEILQRYYEHDDAIAKFVTMIIESGEQMLNIITNLLDVNRIESGNLTLNIQPIPLNIIEHIVAGYQQRALHKDIALHYVPEKNDALSRILVDEQAFQQVIDNLISNAIKYSPHQKNVWIRVLSQRYNDGKVVGRIEVQDEGEGISPGDMTKLFRKFARLSARPTGGEHSTGLGLSIVKKIVEAMNGRVWCESELGKGATFIVELPCGNM